MKTRVLRHMRLVKMSRETEAAGRRASQQLGVRDSLFIEQAIAQALEAIATDDGFRADDVWSPAEFVDQFLSEDLVG